MRREARFPNWQSRRSSHRARDWPRQPTITPVETAHHSAIPGHLGLISMLVKRKLKWDAQKECILGDPDASKLLGRPYRAPWKIAGYTG